MAKQFKKGVALAQHVDDAAKDDEDEEFFQSLRRYFFVFRGLKI